MNVTTESIQERVREYLRLGEKEFLRSYASGRGSRTRRVIVDGHSIPAKALFAAAHSPPVPPVTIHTNDAIKWFHANGYEFDDPASDQVFEEGERRRLEATYLARSSALVRQAKTEYGFRCMCCEFDFESFYGEIGEDFIECHHIDPLTGREGKSMPTSIKDLTVLCSNCHRMVHRVDPCLTVAELRERIAQNAAQGRVDDRKE
ncbi:HNH endonuclease [Oricola sp.]|uniref:HNH endonuclease n=1 Tax=Oricola sp. TaxID=1979950 RepID=UPI0025E9A66A|nr:HNH endonuclease [Oricola sp.]MCI5076810.1 HNH endonuclease [Oricola sp.]